MSQWIEIIPTDKKTFPPEKVEVLTKMQDKNGIRNICILSYSNNLFWHENMYVYYTPTHWKLINAKDTGESDVICPFCNEKDFDLIGLKAHLLRGWCSNFNDTSQI